MKYGVIILPEARWATMCDRWRSAESMGFDHAWTYDHLAWRTLRDKPWFGCVPTLAAAAGCTSEIRLGTLVATPSYRHPITFAKEVMSLDDISGGRIICGIGSGAGGLDEEVFGPVSARAATADRSARFAEFVELTDLLLRQSETHFEGRFYQSVGARMIPGCLQAPRTPLAVAGTGPRAMRVAGCFADMWVTAGEPGRFDGRSWESMIPDIAQQVRDFESTCRAIGRDPTSVDKALVTGAAINGMFDSVRSFVNAAEAFATLGFTDLLVHWPRTSDPYRGSENMLRAIADEVAVRS